MKTTLLVLAAAALSGCAVYPSPAYETYETPVVVVVPYGVVQQPTYIYGGAYPYGYRSYPRGYNRPHHHAAPAQPRVHVPHPGHGVHESIHNRLHQGPPVPPGLPRLPHHRR